MTPIEYPLKAIKQNTSECMQTAATQLLSFFDPSVDIKDVIKKVPIYIENGEKIGTPPGSLGTYFAKQGYQTTTYIFDVELFDRSWKNFTAEEVLVALRKRQEYIPKYSWLSKYHTVLVNSWEMYIKAGGKFSFQILSVKLLRDLLDTAPFILMVNSTYLNQDAKKSYHKDTDKLDPNAITGRSFTHAVTCAGYKENKFLIVDPDPPKGTEHHRWIEQDHLIASIMAAQTESDNLLMTIQK